MVVMRICWRLPEFRGAKSRCSGAICGLLKRQQSAVFAHVQKSNSPAAAIASDCATQNTASAWINELTAGVVSRS